MFGIVLGLTLWQIISVHREIREDKRRRAAASEVTPVDGAAGVDAQKVKAEPGGESGTASKTSPGSR